MIHINRIAVRNAINTIIKEAPSQFSRGRWLVFFPEGTRVPLSEKKRYKIGAAVVANELNVPIIPIAHNAGKLWKKNAFIKKPGTIIVKFGDEIYPEGKRPDEMMSLVKKNIEKLITKSQTFFRQKRYEKRIRKNLRLLLLYQYFMMPLIQINL